MTSAPSRWPDEMFFNLQDAIKRDLMTLELHPWLSAVLLRAALVVVMAGIPWLAGCQTLVPKERTVGVTLTGLDHLAAHLSIQDFWVNGTAGHQAGGGGRSVCCATVPDIDVPRQTVTVRWGVTNWPHKAYSMHERVVPIERHDRRGTLFIHFLRDGTVRAVLYDGYPEKPGYPGPSYATVLNKKPWTLYKRQPGEPLFTEVPDAAALGGPTR